MAPSATSFQFTVIGVAVMVVLGAMLWFGSGPDPPPEPTAAPTIAVNPGASITVHVAGAVASPGLVSLSSPARVADAVAAAGGATWEADLGSVNLAAPVRDGERVVLPVAGVEGGPAAGDVDAGFDLNAATEAELTELPGVGPVLAARIVSHRSEHGPFATVEDLLDVSGIGEAKLAMLRDHITAP